MCAQGYPDVMSHLNHSLLNAQCFISLFYFIYFILLLNELKNNMSYDKITNSKSFLIYQIHYSRENLDDFWITIF